MTRRLPPITTRVARAGYVDHRSFGWSAFKDLLGHEDYTGLMVMAVTGRRVTEEQRAMFNELAGALNVADPRIWPPKLIRVLSSYGGTLASFAGGMLAMETDFIGPWTIKYSALTLLELRADIGDGHLDDERAVDEGITRLLSRQKKFIGYGVPFRPVDERLEALRACVYRRGRQGLPNWRLMEALTARMKKDRNLGPNIASGVSACILDLGYGADDVAPLTVFMNLNVFVANAVEGARQQPAVLRSLPLDVIDYVGTPPRTSPRARARP